MVLNLKHKKIDRNKEKGLSLIESAMVLALAATVTAGVMFYYQSASDSNKTQSAISEVMSATSAINGLYIGQSGYSGLTASVLTNSSAIPDNYKSGTGNNAKILNPFGGELKVGSASDTNNTYGYYLQLTGLPKSACISLATLNLGTSAKGYGVKVTPAPDFNSFAETPSASAAKSSAISPSQAADLCDANDASNSVTYFMK